MKSLAFAIMAVFLSFMTTVALATAPRIIIPVPPKEEKKPTVKDYEMYFGKYKTHSDNLTNTKFWNRTTLKNKETGKLMSWKDVPEKDRRLVVLMFADKISVEMKNLQVHWEKEVETLKEGEKDEEDKPATLADVEAYLTKLIKLRKTTAIKYENMAEQYFKDFEKDYTKEEAEKHLKSIRDWHDREKLIERK